MEIIEDNLIKKAQDFIGYLQRGLASYLSKRQFKDCVANQIFEYYYAVDQFEEQASKMMQKIRLFIHNNGKTDPISSSINKYTITGLNSADLYKLEYDPLEAKFYTQPLPIKSCNLKTDEDYERLHNLYYHKKGTLIRHIKLIDAISHLSGVYTGVELEKACSVFIYSIYAM